MRTAIFLLALLLFIPSQPLQAGPSSGFVVSPGFYIPARPSKSTYRFGREISVNHTTYSEGVFSFAGIAAGSDDKHSYTLGQVGGSGWLLAGGSIGAGVFTRKVDKVSGIQADLTFQFLTPFLIYARYRHPLDKIMAGAEEHRRFELGLMYKFPIPAAWTTEKDDKSKSHYILGIPRY